MLAKLSVDQALMKAKSHANRGEIDEAQKIYQSVFQSYSKQAKDIKSGLSDLNKFSRITTTQDPPEEIINELINLYKQGQFSLAVEQAQILTKQYPDNFTIWNIMGASAAQIDMTDEAIIAFKKVISIKPEYPDVYGNMGLVLQEQDLLLLQEQDLLLLLLPKEQHLVFLREDFSLFCKIRVRTTPLERII